MITIKKITQSKYFTAIMGAFGCLIAAVIVFAFGVKVGEHRAKYSYQWGANYERNFVGGQRAMMDGSREIGGRGEFGARFRGMMPGSGDFRNGHGVSGIITSIIDNNIVIKDRGGKENTIAVNEKTVIKDGRIDIKITDLRNDEKIVAIGNPGDDGVVNADLIRIFEK